MQNVRFVAAILVAMMCREVKSQVIVGSNIEFSSGTGDDFLITTYLNIDREEGSCGTACTLTNDHFQYENGILTNIAPDLPPPSRSYYLANHGDIFREIDAINFGQIPPIDTGGVSDFYLSIAAAFGGAPKNFGWIHLQLVGDDLVMLGNAMAYNSRGIVIGTDIAVPEPTTAATMLLSVAFFSQRHLSRRNLCCEKIAHKSAITC